jgi:hypothetical protein
MTLTMAALWANNALEALLLLLLLRGGIFRQLPAFCCYLLWNLSCNVAMTSVYQLLSTHAYLRIYLAVMILDALFEFAVLAELARVVARYSRAESMRRYLLLLLLALATMLLWSLANWSASGEFSRLFQVYSHFRQLFAILRVAILLALAWWSSLQGFRWPEAALRVAAGMGFYSIVELTVIILHTRQNPGPPYAFLDQIVLVSYLSTLLYWVLVFAQKRAKKQNFSVQM